MEHDDILKLTGYPAYSRPGSPKDPLALTARAVFLNAMTRETPEAVSDLQNTVLSECSAVTFNHAVDLLQEENPPVEEAARAREVVSRVLGLITAWMARFGLAESRDEWIHAHVVFAWGIWGISELARKIMAFPSHLMKGPVGARLEFSLPGWDTRSEQWIRYRQRAESEFAKTLAEYKESVESAARAGGYQPVRQSRARVHPDPNVRYEWLALRLCRGYTYDHIAADYSSKVGRHRLTENGVSKAIKAGADVIGLRVPRRAKARFANAESEFSLNS